MRSLHFVDEPRIVHGNDPSERVRASSAAGTGKWNSREGMLQLGTHLLDSKF